MSDDQLRFLRLVTVLDSFERDVICAHLAAEGILYQVRGSTPEPYRMNVHPMSPLEIWVPEAEISTARAVIAARGDTDVDPVEDVQGGDGSESPSAGEDADVDIDALADLTGVPLPPTGPMSGRNDDELSDGYLRSARPDRRSVGPPPPTRRRRAIS